MTGNYFGFYGVVTMNHGDDDDNGDITIIAIESYEKIRKNSIAITTSGKIYIALNRYLTRCS